MKITGFKFIPASADAGTLLRAYSKIALCKSFAAKRQNKFKSVFSGDMRVGENTLRLRVCPKGARVSRIKLGRKSEIFSQCHSGAFFILANLLGKPAGVGESFSTMTARRTMPPGRV